MLLTAQEIRELAGMQRPSAQFRALKSMGIECRQRPDSSVVVLRAVVEAVLGGGLITPKVEAVIPEPQLILRNGGDPKVRPWDIAKGRKSR
ncbi:MAG TPA: DUF4224 domain-containing protein [Accumulibacter sp.]|uniref:DUF4224 domain-containing protein n=1 Tax=Accumulibacter sp. TaxID=2053492 RepID=UPI002CF5D0CC|nr:DUF4224 domain-containing protein [Accumulibacter sp.]HMW57439.1 DUF4224 domain-containing protein [Accumulibacter sp.]HNE34622.1 DUF4224 domain-containing protein [Nitrospira sp.]